MTEKSNSPNKLKEKLPQILLFWSTWIFVVFLSKKIFSAPSNGAGFLFKKIATFITAIILTGAMIRFIPAKFYIILMPLPALKHRCSIRVTSFTR